ncbi:MAG: NAD(P)-binding protein [Bacteroidales bacterium]|nr:NAD(P)-binding protein [Bacteroidales bacterium]
MERIAVIGAGVSGLTVANLLKHKYIVKVFEKEAVPGGLIRCRRVQGNLFHICGGHIFNSRRSDVLDWFWAHFDRESEFLKADRNSVVAFPDGRKVPYPVEDHVYLFPEETQKKVVSELVELASKGQGGAENFEEFLQKRFGRTLYELYFKPYNEKVWRRPLGTVPLSWLEGKLPMPSVQEILFNNINRVQEKAFVHSSFWYEKKGGSQFIADRLSESLDIVYGADIASLSFDGAKWTVAGELFDVVVFCGNLKDLPQMLHGVDAGGRLDFIDGLEYHGTTSVLCTIDANPYSWVYQPGHEHKSHRIICTGNFAESNNAPGKLSASIEFTDDISKEEIIDNLSRMPFHPEYIDHNYSRYTYPIQDAHTREQVAALKDMLAGYRLYLSGRFADWEYYNMDVAMGAAMDLCKTL